jgi:hypothetical protein
MSRDFKFNFDQIRETHLEKKDDSHAGESHVRNVCFEQTDGKIIFLNYAYLVSGEYLPDENMIVLYFTSHTVTLKGVGLAALYQDFFTHTPKHIACSDERYNAIDGENWVVNTMEVVRI